ncbi:winged helix-turn-helix transcriptional regulator [Streptomyces liangshanensis]|uniref:Helix-turn-helix transcriptional regulator n=1 Tax=Streptomyces liangshanensis TaxID=2717324 RepID=A0A6G9H504_9ACTN|nr:helix-turn-helix domain-containing protein [Streptomyces liangshanensis]QIQ05311.1 helix-turn-helix transcriptional regulator [Streptomyces liangshanensis]
MSRLRRMPRRRSYDQYCSAARALDAVGDRWTLLIVRELLAGPRRYTDLHADLPGVSTDVLASRLKDMERDELATRRKLPPPAAAVVYELTERGRELLPVLTALARWGAPALAERRPTDAVRAHWFAVPLMPVLAACAAGAGAGAEGVVEVRLDEGVFHVRLGGGAPGPVADQAVDRAADPAANPVAYGDGPADAPDARLVLDADTCRAVGAGTLALADAVRDGRIEVSGDGPLAKALRGA